jgi:hypothetical protein
VKGALVGDAWLGVNGASVNEGGLTDGTCVGCETPVGVGSRVIPTPGVVVGNPMDGLGDGVRKDEGENVVGEKVVPAGLGALVGAGANV